MESSHTSSSRSGASQASFHGFVRDFFDVAVTANQDPMNLAAAVNMLHRIDIETIRTDGWKRAHIIETEAPARLDPGISASSRPDSFLKRQPHWKAHATGTCTSRPPAHPDASRPNGRTGNRSGSSSTAAP